MPRPVGAHVSGSLPRWPIFQTCDGGGQLVSPTRRQGLVIARARRASCAIGGVRRRARCVGPTRAPERAKVKKDIAFQLVKATSRRKELAVARAAGRRLSAAASLSAR